MSQLKYWDGAAWVQAVVGATGPIGPTGPLGPTGNVASVSGTGPITVSGPSNAPVVGFDASSTAISASSVTAGSFVKTSGTSAQFLKADGSTDSTSYPPTVITGTNVYIPNPYGVPGTWIAGTGYFNAIPVFINKAVTADRISLNVTVSGSAGGVLRMGIYNSDSNFQPTTLLLDAGTIASTTTGLKEITISQALSPGVYWIGAAGQVASAGTCSAYTANPFTGMLSTPTYYSSAAITGYQMGPSITGALPSTFTVGFAGNGPNVAPMVRLRVS